MSEQRLTYFAYGSNMCTGRLHRSVPSARPKLVAKLPGHAFRFHKRSDKDHSGKGNAFHTRNSADVVWGVVFSILASEKPALDKQEGLGKGYAETTVTVLERDGTEHEAFTYVAEAFHLDDTLQPYSWYKRFVVEGAQQHGLPVDYVRDIEAMPACEDRDRSRDRRKRDIDCRTSSRLQKLKQLAIGLAVVAAVVIGFRQQYYESVSVIGGIGMDDVGRQVFCQTLDTSFKQTGEFEVQCKGFHKQEIVMIAKDVGVIDLLKLPEEVVGQMRKPYAVALEGIDGIVLRGDKLEDRIEDPTTIVEVKRRLDKLGARTVGDFYAACGFTSFVVRAQDGTVVLELAFSAGYGRNPTVVR